MQSIKMLNANGDLHVHLVLLINMTVLWPENSFNNSHKGRTKAYPLRHVWRAELRNAKDKYVFIKHQCLHQAIVSDYMLTKFNKIL